MQSKIYRKRQLNFLSRRDVLGMALATPFSAVFGSHAAMAAPGERGDLTAVAQLVDRERVIRWALELAGFYSPTGNEGDVAAYLCDELRKLGLRTKLQHIAPSRDNAIGRLEGLGGGQDLMFTGHLDTFAISNFDKHPYTYDIGRSVYPSGAAEPQAPRAIDDQWLFGHDIANMKSAFAAYLGAVDALIRSDVSRKGAVLITGVAGTTPTLAWTEGNQGPTDDELGIGTRHMLNHGVTADMCVLGEPTNLTLVPAHTGRLRLKLTLITDAPRAPGEKAGRVLKELQDWIPDYKRAHQYNGVTPAAFLYGPLCRQDYVGGDCSLFLEMRVLPNQHPLDMVEQVRKLTQRLSAADPTLEIHIETLLVEPGSELKLDAPVVRALQDAHQQVEGTLPETSYVGWGADATRLNQAGIPTLIYGPGGNMQGIKGYPGDSKRRPWEYQNIDELERAARVYAIMAADVCSRDRT